MSSPSPSINTTPGRDAPALTLKKIGNLIINQASSLADTLSDSEAKVDDSPLEINITANNQDFSPIPTDLVRLYFQDINRVPLLRQEEELAHAQSIHRYFQVLNICEQAINQEDTLLQRYVALIALGDRLGNTKYSSTSLKHWAKEAEISVEDLTQILRRGKAHWADLAQLTVEELDNIQNAGLQSRTILIKSNLRLVVSIAKKYQNRGLELLDLIQEGSLGLEHAVEKFDFTKGYRFSTYAYFWIQQAMTRAIASSGRNIRLPIYLVEKINKIRRAQYLITQQKGRNATLVEIGQSLEMTAEKVQEILLQIPRSISLDLKVGKDQEAMLVDLLMTSMPSPEDILMKEALFDDIQELIAELDEREQEIIRLRYGLKDGSFHSLQDIGQQMNLSRERIRQLEVKAIAKLRSSRKIALIHDYFDCLDSI